MTSIFDLYIQGLLLYHSSTYATEFQELRTIVLHLNRKAAVAQSNVAAKSHANLNQLKFEVNEKRQVDVCLTKRRYAD